MQNKRTHRAVLDRIEDGHAVLLLGEGEKEVICDFVLVPEGMKGGDHVHVHLSEGQVVQITSDPEATAATRSRISDKMRKLRARSKGGTGR